MPSARAMIPSLFALARHYGVTTRYRDGTGRWHVADADVLAAVLAALGAPLSRPADAPDAWRAVARQASEPPPVVVHWLGTSRQVRIPWPAADPAAPLRAQLGAEDGTERDTRVRVEAQGPNPRLVFSPPAAPGYYRLRLETRATAVDTLLIAAPRTAAAAPEPRGTTLFCPPWALWSRSHADAGTYAELAALARLAAARGLGTATLPLLPTYLGPEAFDPSPYAPVTRLFFADAYLPGPSAERDPEDRRVDWHQVGRRTRLVPDVRPERDPAFSRWLSERPEAYPYARFRAAGERLGRAWPDWPDGERRGPDGIPSADPRVVRRHLARAWAAEQAVAALAAAAHPGTGLMLDLPLGVRGDGFDPFWHRALFAPGMAVGAPPDALAPGGQNWGFPPLSPHAVRRDGYRYVRTVLARHMRHARWLRLDHVMALSRLFWIPAGAEASAGVYVRYPAEEWYAVLAVESHRYGTAVVGEDLGNVPAAVRTVMGRHRVHRLWVAPFEGPDSVPPSLSVATLATHDMPPFAAWWAALAPSERAQWATRWGVADDAPVAVVLDRALEALARSPAALVVVSLEDLLGATTPQNVPGTSSRENWRERLPLPFDDLAGDAEWGRRLERIAGARARSADRP